MYRASQLIASTRTPFSLKEGAQSVAIDFREDVEAALQQLASGNLSLHFDHMKSQEPLPVIDVYLNLEQGDRPDEKNHVDSMALYGLPQSSEPSAGQDGGGQDRVLDAGAAFQRARDRSNWSGKRFTLTLVPARPLSPGATLTIGRIALYFHQW